MKRIFITLTLIFAFSSIFQAQDMSRRQHMKFAKKMLKAHNYLDAAIHFEKASEVKPNDDLFYEAGVNYAKARDYASANRCFSKIKSASDFDDLLLEKGRILKNLGKYEDAIQSFSDFLAHYDKKDKVKKEHMISLEIKGCTLALDQPNPDFDIELLSDNINSQEENEFAPYQVGDNLYFSSTLGDFMNIYRSELEDGNWLFSVIPQNFNQLQGKNFCNGSFSSDLTKFYFNICETNNYEQQNCSIYLIENEGGVWSDPQKLPDVINVEGTTNIHPASTIKDGKEYLYFSSNRANGQGGMDLWYVTRAVDGDYQSFSAPRNLGPNINTTQDEITPFYDKGVLYYSSNGHPSIGGFDVFKSKGMAFKWSTSVNMGVPINSSADDTYYFLNDDGKYGYVTSNRKMASKTATTNDDIFSFYPSSANYSFTGNVYDKTSKLLLDDVSVTVYEKNGGNENLLTSEDFPNGNFNLGLLPDRQLILLVAKPGYKSDKYTISTFATDAVHQDKNFYLEQEVNYPSTASTSDVLPVEAVINEDASTKVQNENVVTEENVVSNTTSVSETPVNTTVAPSSDISEPSTPVEYSDPNEAYHEPMTTTGNVVHTEVSSTELPEPSIMSHSDVTTTTSSSPNLPRVIRSYEPAIQSNPAVSVTSSNEGLPKVIKSYEPELASGPVIEGDISTQQLPSHIKSYEPELRDKVSTTEYINNDGQFNYDGSVYTTRSSTKYEPGAFSTAAKKYSGTYYKVQLMAIKHFDPAAPRFNSVAQLGELDTEYLYDKELTRVLLSHFISLDDAKDVRDYARKNGFKGAFIVKYQDGQRQGQHF